MFYPDGFASNYDKLITYYPRFYRDVREMDAILRMHGKLADNLESNIERVLNDSFIDFSDEETIAKLERILKIDYSNIVGKTLDERREQVKSYFIGIGNLSASMIKEMLKAYTDVDVYENVDIKFEDYMESIIIPGIDQALYISIEQDGDQRVDVPGMLSLLRRVVPAHLVYIIILAMTTIVDCTEIEHFYFTELGIGMDINFWGDPQKLDGSALLDGSLLLNARIYGMDTSVNIMTGFKTGPESITGAVVISYDFRYLDGCVLLDGSVYLDSKIDKEDL